MNAFTSKIIFSKFKICNLNYIVIIIFLLVSCSSEKIKPKINTAIKVQELPAQESWNSKIIFTDSGKTKAILYVGHLRMFTQSLETLIDSNLNVNFYNLQQIKTTTLTSKRGRVDDRTKDLYAFENVVAVNDSGVTLKTEQLMWRNQDRKIVSDKFVTIDTKIEHIEGIGFESDQHLRNYIIYKVTYVTTADTLK